MRYVPGVLVLPPQIPMAARQLMKSDAAMVQVLCDESVDYYQLVYGGPASANEGLEILTELPPGKPSEDKFVFGFFAGNRFVGVLDLVRDFRSAGEWYLGLLLLTPDARGHHHGSLILDATFHWLRHKAARSIRLACAEQNEQGRRFWERHGFRSEATFPPRQLGSRQTVLMEYVRSL